MYSIRIILSVFISKQVMLHTLHVCFRYVVVNEKGYKADIEERVGPYDIAGGNKCRNMKRVVPQV